MKNKRKWALHFNICHCCEFPLVPVTPVSCFGEPHQTTAVTDGCVSVVRASVSLALICASRCVSRRPDISQALLPPRISKKKKTCSLFVLLSPSCWFEAELAAKKKKKLVSISRPHLSLLPLFCCHRSSHLFQSFRLRALRLSGSKL